MKDFATADVTRMYREEYAQALNSLGRFNLAIFGKTGTGKSTLVNAIFGEDIAATGTGRPVTTGFKISGSARGRDGSRVRPLISVDAQGQIVEASCTCAFYKKHTLTRGPCEHMLALRLAHMARLAAEDAQGGKGGGVSS